MIQRLCGRIVLVAVVVFGLWFVISHYHGVSRFGCAASDDDAAHAADVLRAVGVVASPIGTYPPRLMFGRMVAE
ncbi:MAG TPA: hypothetical protein VG317_14675 [Pseudonocardiaceae bacterium]|nr:hypothetical protein [Pseudonocardiaceae bacterium]